MAPIYKWVKNKDDRRAINDYDNAILYDDFVISQLLNETRKYDTEVKSKTGNKSESRVAFFFFPDHGEGVKDSGGFMGHYEGRGTFVLYEIPFCGLVQ